MSTREIFPWHREPLFWLWLVALVLGFWFNLWAVPLFDVDEGAFAEASREMLERGDFITTYLNGELRFDKPILIYWLQAASITLLGPTELAVRLPSALAATAWSALVVWFLARYRDRRTGLAAGTILATCLSLTVIGRAATADALLNLWLWAALAAIFAYWKEGRRGFLLAAHGAIGLGLLTKGPVAVLVPLAVSGLFYGSLGQWRDWLKAVCDPRGLALLLSIAAPWYVAEYLAQGQAFIDGFFLKHNVGRFTGPMEGHAGSLFYYLPVVVLGVLPFTAALLVLLPRWRGLWADPLQRYLLLLFLFVLVFFSLSGTKLPHYVNYGLTGVVALMAIHLSRLRSGFWALLPAALWLGALLAVPWILDGIEVVDPFYRAALAEHDAYFGPRYLIACTLALVIVGVLMALRRWPVDLRLLLAGPAGVLVLAGFFIPAVGEMIQGPVKEAALLVRAQGYPSVVQYRVHWPSFSFYRRAVTPRRAPRPGEVILTDVGHAGDWPQAQVLYRRGGVVLLRL